MKKIVKRMGTAVMLVLALVVSLAGGLTSGTLHAAPESAPVGQATACEPTQSIIENFADVLDLHTDVLDEDDWDLSVSYDELDYRIRVSRFPVDTTGLVSINYLIYDCGYDIDDLEDYYDEDYFELFLETYTEAERTDECTDGGLMLYEYELEFEGDDYIGRFWVVEYSRTRVYDVLVTFLADEEDRLDEVSEDLFPELSSCAR